MVPDPSRNQSRRDRVRTSGQGRSMSLTPKQAQFVREYLTDLNATQAAMRAGYSARTAEVQGCRLLSNVKIAEAVQFAMEARSKRTEITADRVLEEFAKIGFADVRKIFTAGGALLSPADMDDATAATIASVEVVTRRLPGAEGEAADVEYVHKVKAWDKVSALTHIGRHLGMFKDKVEHSFEVPDELQSWL